MAKKRQEPFVSSIQSQKAVVAHVAHIYERNASEAPASVPLPHADTPPTYHNGASGRIHLNRQHILWADLNKKCRHYFLACGTSLQPLLNRGLVRLFHTNNVKEVKIILPCTERGTLSRRQLQEYDLIDPKPVADCQVESAFHAYTGLAGHIKEVGWTVEEHLRRYLRIMFSNITVIDRDAFISFYDDQGVGDQNITLHFNEGDSPDGYNAVIKLFRRLWEDSVIIPCPPPVPPATSSSPKKRKQS